MTRLSKLNKFQLRNKNSNISVIVVDPGRVDSKRRLSYIYGERPLPTRDFTLEDFCTRATSHGLADWYEAKSTVAKWWWASLILLSISVLLWQISQEIYEYYTGPIQTSMSFIPSTEIKFPQVYICPLSFVNKDCVRDWTEYRQHAAIFHKNVGSLLEQTVSYAQNIAGSVSDIRPAFGPEMLQGGSVASNAFKGMPAQSPPIICGPQNDGYLKHMAMAVPDYFTECKFGSKNVSCDCITETFLDKEFGICYLVDVSKATKALQTTENIGLKLVIDAHTEYYPTEFPAQQADFKPIFKGAVVRVGSPIDPSTFGGTLVQVGTYSKLSLESDEVNLIDIEYSSTPQHCVANGERSMQFFNSTEVSYSAEACKMDCTQVVINKTCGCVVPFDKKWINSNYASAQSCNDSDFKNCVQLSIENSRITQAELNDCTKNCYLACHSWKYRTSLSSLSLPLDKSSPPRTAADIKKATCPSKRGKSFSVEYKDQPSSDGQDLDSDNQTLDAQIPSGISRWWNQDFIVLDIAFERLQYTSIQQSPPKTLTTLVSNIGGQAGLWTGASIFSIVQVFVFAAYLSYSKLGKPSGKP